MAMMKKTSAALLILEMAMLAFAGQSEAGQFDPQCITRDCMPQCMKIATASVNACHRACDEYCHQIAGRGDGPVIWSTQTWEYSPYMFPLTPTSIADCYVVGGLKDFAFWSCSAYNYFIVIKYLKMCSNYCWWF